MLGDPDLNAENQDDWISLIWKCQPSKMLPKQLHCAKDAKCLERVASLFEEFTVNSTLFQLSSSEEPKRKHFLKLKRHTDNNHQCICSAQVSVRWWTTTSDELHVQPGEGNPKGCAFNENSHLFLPTAHLIAIPNYGNHFTLGASPILQLEAIRTEEGNTVGTSANVATGDNSSHVLTSNQNAIPVIDPKPLHTTEPSNFPKDASKVPPLDTSKHDPNGSSDDEEPSDTILEHDYTSAEAVREERPYLSGERRCLSIPTSVDVSILIQSGQQHLWATCRHGRLQEASPESVSVSETPRAARRPRFFSTRIPPRDTSFFGREKLLRTLDDLITPQSTLREKHRTILDPKCVIMLRGAPGVGKSAVALELVYRSQGQFDHVLWLRANDEIHLALSFHEAAVSLGLVQGRSNHDHERSRHRLLAWLSTTTAKWLLLFDDADDIRILPHYTPKADSGVVLVSSRGGAEEWPPGTQGDHIHTIEVAPFSVEEGIAFLRSFTRLANDTADESCPADLRLIAEICRCLPLDLRKVGTMLNRQKWLKDVLLMPAIGRWVDDTLFSQPSGALTYGYLSSASSALTNVITFLDPCNINDALLLGAQRIEDFDFPLRSYPMTDEGYFIARDELVHNSLCRRGGSDALEIHRMTHEALRERLDPGQFRLGFRSASKLLEACWPSERKMKNIVLGNWPEFDSLHCHVSSLSMIYVEYYQRRIRRGLAQDPLNDAYVRILLQSIS